MNEEIDIQRRRVADLARNFLAGNLSWKEFMASIPETDDDLIGEVVDLIEHEPKRGGLLGVKENEWLNYQADIRSAIEVLEQSVKRS